MNTRKRRKITGTIILLLAMTLSLISPLATAKVNDVIDLKPPSAVSTDATFFNFTTTGGFTQGVADPHVLYDAKSGYYYAYSTDGAQSGYRFGIYRSADLITWERLNGAIRTTETNQWANDWFWAPECYYNENNGYYYLFYSGRMTNAANSLAHFGFSNFEESCKTGVAVSTSPEGPFTSITKGPIDYYPYDPDYHDVNQIMDSTQKKPPATLAAGQAAPLGVYIPFIDANVFFDDNGRIFLYYSRNAYRNWVWDSDLGKYIEESNIYAVELNTDWWYNVKPDETPIMPTVKESYINANKGENDGASVRKDGFVPIINYGSDKQSWENAHVNDYTTTSGSNKDRRWAEGSFTMKYYYKGEAYYYIVYSCNNWENQYYGEGYAVSKSPLGPFKKSAGNPIVARDPNVPIYSTGHGSYVPSPDGSELFHVYHGRSATSGSRRVYTNKMAFDEANLENGLPTLKVTQVGGDQPIPSGVAPYSISVDAQRAVYSFPTNSTLSVAWSVTNANGGVLGLTNTSNRVNVSVSDTSVATYAATGSTGAAGRLTFLKLGSVNVTFTYQRLKADRTWADVSNINGDKYERVSVTRTFSAVSTVDGITDTLTKDGYRLVTQLDGPDLTYHPNSGVSILKVDGFAFKDLNRNGTLDVYEDWRKPAVSRAKDLSAKMAAAPDNVQQIAGLMLYSAHYAVSSATPTAAQLTYLADDNLRHVLVTTSSPETNAKWNNNVQSFVEGLKFGIPVNSSSDPRHSASISNVVEYYVENNGVSAWPSSLGLAATFNPAVTKSFGKIASLEYRMLGIATALSPQIDIATDPRWSRFSGTFGEDPKLASEMSKAYVDGFQTTYSGDGVNGDPVAGGWGKYSVNAMMKHWPGGGAGEGGRDAHYDYGKYAVYPGGNWNAHLIPFVDGSLSLDDGTSMATAVMPYYTVSYMQAPGSEPNSSNSAGAKLNMGNAYSEYMLNGVLRDAYEFEGVVCTDWNVVGPKTAPGNSFDYDKPGMIWGADDHFGADGFTMSDMARRARMLLDAGVDQFGGLNTIEPIVTAYNEASGADQQKLLAQLETSAYRLLMNIFRTNLFENPYLDPDVSKATIGKEEFMEAGYKAQLDSVVLLKDSDGIMPISKTDNKKIYAPGASASTLTLLRSYFGTANIITAASGASGCDYAIVFISSPSAGGGSRPSSGGVYSNRYTPINLDFVPYTASYARAVSIAGIPIRETSSNINSPVIGMENRSYIGLTTNQASAATTAVTNINAAQASGKPVILFVSASSPFVMTQIEPKADVIMFGFGVQLSVALDMMTGFSKYGNQSNADAVIYPTAMLPMQMPKNMNEVELQYEDVPRDMDCYTDSKGNTYDFGFGLTWKNGSVRQIDGTVNPGYITFVANNTEPMRQPVNKGNSASAFAIENRVNVKFDYGYKAQLMDKENANMIKIVNSGDTVTIVDLPDRGALTNYGWYNGSVRFDFGKPITENITLMAKWILPVTSIRVDSAASTAVKRGDTVTFKVVLNEGATADGIVWTINNALYANVDPSTGTVKILNKTGTAVLTATDSYNGLSHSIILRIT